VFNVKDCGADGTGEKDDTAAVQAALARAQENGGGVVYFPRGRYQVSETLTIPRFTVLRGEGREQVNLFWPDTETPLPALVRGTNSFGLEDLTLYASNYGHVIVGDTGDKPEAGNVFLRRLRVRGVLYRGHPTAQQVHDRFVAFQKLSSGGGDTVQLGGDNLEITDCDLYGSGRSFVLGWARGALLSGNTFYNGRWGWYDIYNSEQVIFEHNQIIGADLMSTGGGLSCWQTTRPYQQNIYFGHNTFQNMHGWDREAMTSDGGGGAYYGAVGDATADTLFLPAGEKWHAQDLVGMTCFVLGGRGQGQWRTVVRADERSTGLDRPWEVVPDRTSLVGVVMTHRHYLLVGNEFTDCGIAIQFYGTALEHLVAGNRCTRGGGFHSIGKQYGGYDFPPEKSPAHQPDWFVQFLDNEILEGNCYRYNANNAALAGESHVGVYGWASRSGWPWPYNLGAVVRRNHLHNNAHVEVSGACAEVVVENNRIERADAGVVVDGGRGVLLRGNQFAEVRAPYTGAALPQAYLSPMERTEGQLEALRTLLQGAGLREDPAQWPEVKALLREGEAPAEPREGEAPAEPREGEAPAEPSEAAERSRQILTTALAHVARLCPDGLPLQSLAPLLGLRLEVAPESPLHEVIQSGRGGTGELTLRVSAPADGLPLPVGAQVQTPAGWTVERTPEPVPLKPGEAVPLTIPLTIPPGTWGSHELPVTLGLAVGGETLRLHSRVPVGSGFLRDWMVIGPFPNKTGSPLDLTLHPPDDGVDLRAEYDGLKGKVRWQPVHVTGTPLDLRALLQTAEPAVAYTVACVEAEGETPAVLRLGSSGGVALLLNGQPLWSVDQSRAAAPDQDRLPLTLRAGDNVLLFKVCTASDPWQFIAELAPPPGGSLIAPPQSPPTLGGRGAGAGGWGSRLRVVPPEEFAGRAAFAPPPPRPSLPEGGEV
jgi:hypothetical protein